MPIDVVRMLHLILPPIIVVLALILLVYSFSRKFFEVDRAVRSGSLLQDVGSDESGLILALRRFSLRFLERIAQGSKVASLRAYNSLHRLTQSLREKRQKDRTRGEALRRPSDLLKYSEDVSPAFSEPEILSPDVEFERSGRLHQEQPEPSVDSRAQVKEKSPISATLLRRQSARNQSKTAAMAQEVEKPLRPMVSRRMTRPEVPGQAKEEKSQLEEILIERIAANPRDIEAYERLGDYYLDQSNLQDAKECYRQVLRLSPVHRLAKVKIRKLERMLEQKSNI